MKTFKEAKETLENVQKIVYLSRETKKQKCTN